MIIPSSATFGLSADYHMLFPGMQSSNTQVRLSFGSKTVSVLASDNPYPRQSYPA